MTLGHAREDLEIVEKAYATAGDPALPPSAVARGEHTT